MKKIAVLLTCYNRKLKTISCLDSLNNCILPNNYSIDIYLVNDGCTDGTEILVKNIYPKVNIIEGTGDLYWNNGMHLAWTTSMSVNDYDYYLWLNDDTLLISTAILELLECDQLVCGSSIVCGAIQSLNSNTFTYGGHTIDKKNVEPNGDIQYCDIMNGNCVLVNNKICKTIGVLDPIYPHSMGDHEYGFRAKKNGFYIITTRMYIGKCDYNSIQPKWQNSSTPFLERLKSLYSPLGYCHPKYFFIYERKCYGLGRAVKHFISIHLRVLFPSFWEKI